MLQGYKTYLVGAVMALLTGLKYMGHIDQDTYDMLMKLLTGGGLVTLAAKVNRLNGKFMLIAGLLLLTPNYAHAQGNVVPSDKLAWDQQASSLAEAQSYVYKRYDDGSATGVALTGVTCAGTTAPYVCSVAYPAYTPGSHSVQVTASNAAGESSKSAPFTFTFVVIPAAPTNVRKQ